MQYVLLTVASKEGFITGVDWFTNKKEPKEPFIFQYQGEVIRQHIFREEEGEIFYNLISLYDPEIIKRLDVFDEERKEGLNKDK